MDYDAAGMGTGTSGSNPVCGVCNPGAGTGSQTQRCPADSVSLGGDERDWRRSSWSSADDRAPSGARALDSGQLTRCDDPCRGDPVAGRDFCIVLLHTSAKGVLGRSDGGAEVRMNEALAGEPCLACGSPAEPDYSFV